jgi:hypothetical protein
MYHETVLISQHINYSAVYILPAWAISASWYTKWSKENDSIFDDVLSLNNSRFGNFVDRTYPIELEIKDTTDAARSTSYLDLHLKIDSEGQLRTKLYDNRDDFNFPIFNFPFICSNIPAAPAYVVYISQLILHSRACGSYHNFLDKRFLLTRKLLKQGFILDKLKS